MKNRAEEGQYDGDATISQVEYGNRDNKEHKRQDDPGHYQTQGEDHRPESAFCFEAHPSRYPGKEIHTKNHRDDR